MDIWGPFSKASIHGHKYFLTILYDYSRYTWIVLLKSKSEVKIQVQNFVALVENQFETTVKCIQFNNGPEFLQKDFFSSKGIIHQTSFVYTPQQNGRVERNTNIFLMLLEPSCFNPKFQQTFGVMLLNMPFFL